MPLACLQKVALPKWRQYLPVDSVCNCLLAINCSATKAMLFIHMTELSNPCCDMLAGCYAARSLDTLRAGLTGSPLMAVSAPQSVPHLIWQPRRAHSSAAGAIGDADPKCMVRVRLQLLGRGTVEDGAAILAPRQPALGPGEEAAIGLCTSSAPRGLAGKRGASAVCSAKALWQLAAAWPAQLPKNGKLGPVRVLVKNPRSTVLRPAIAMCWIELPEGDRLM